MYGLFDKRFSIFPVGSIQSVTAIQDSHLVTTKVRGQEHSTEVSAAQ